jgi:hypothetical protein
MTLGKLKLAAVALLVLGLVGVGAAGLTWDAATAGQPADSKGQQAPPPPLSHTPAQPARAGDQEDVWTLDFRCKDPRAITVDVPGKGRKTFWYLLYSVSSPNGQSHTFVPALELATGAKPDGTPDEVVPKVLDAIRRLEDPSEVLEIHDSVTIAAKPLPAARPDTIPKAITGVAIWEDVDPDVKDLTVFVGGLSNAWTVDGKAGVRRKTLKLTFARSGEGLHRGSMRPAAPAEWVYRATPRSPGTEGGLKP